MSTLAWEVTAILGALVAAFLISAAVGNIVSSKFSGRAYLKKQLKRQGVDADRVPDGCVDELVAIADNSGKFTVVAGRDKYNNAFVSMLDTMAAVVKRWIANPNDPIFQSFGGEKDTYRAIPEKYNDQ